MQLRETELLHGEADTSFSGRNTWWNSTGLLIDGTGAVKQEQVRIWFSDDANRDGETFQMK